MRSTNQLIAKWLAQGNAIYEELLRHCQFDTNQAGLVIECPEELLDHIHKASQDFCKPISGGEIYLSCRGEIQFSFSAEVALIYPKKCPNTAPNLLLNLPINLANSISVVAMKNNAGLFCNKKTAQYSRANPDRWIGSNMRDYHIREEFKRFVDTLLEHGSLREFEYKALNFDLEPIALTVNAYLGSLGGEAVRVVEVLNCDLL